MNDCGWKVIEGFSSPDDYERFLVWIAGQVDAGVLAPFLFRKAMQEWVSKRNGSGA